MRIWLDDGRTPPSGYTHHARTAAEAIALLETGRVTFISLDHDLGEEAAAGSGYEVAAHIERQAFLGHLPPLQWQVHSQNPVGAGNMKLALLNAERFWRRSE